MSVFSKRILTLLVAAAALFLFAACEPSGIETYDISSLNTGYDVSSARVFYPANIADLTNVPTTTLSSGMGGTKEGMYWLAEPLAESGIIVLAISARDNMWVEGYKDAHIRGVDIIAEENDRSGSPIRGKVGNVGIIGYSKGGGGVINAASELGGEVTHCVALAPYEPSPRSTHEAATLIFTGTIDVIAPAYHGEGAYSGLPDGVPKLYASMIGEDHMYWHNRSVLGSETDFIEAWISYYSGGDESAYGVFANGAGSGMTDYRFDPADGSSGGGGCN
ncbi:MAG: hypothetical protein AVO39_00540 [delta proteobacterium MLS_D]|jgi:hypothetical protein|nr:MAG: hypothetical protein AVO39_00540 [delta proteobacterium MLS_D]